MADNEGQPPVIDLSFLDTDPSPNDEDNGYRPLTPEQVAALLDEAARSAHDYTRVGRIHMRLAAAVQFADRQCPVDQRMTHLSQLFIYRYKEGAVPDLIDELCRLMSGQADVCPRYQPSDLVSRNEIYARLRAHVSISLIESVRPASIPGGWVLTLNGEDITLADHAQALAWLSAADAFINLLDQQLGKGPDRLWPWVYWLTRCHHRAWLGRRTGTLTSSNHIPPQVPP